MAVIYTLETALKLSCDDLLKEILFQNGEIFKTNAQIQSNSVLGISNEFLRNELQDLEADLSTLSTAYTQKSCGVGNPTKLEPSILLPGTLDFGNVDNNRNASQQFTITNDGTADLIVSSFSPLNSNVFSTVNWPSFPVIIPERGSVPFGIEYNPKPSSIGQESITISFTSNANNSANAITIRATAQKPQDRGVSSLLGRKATGSTRIFTLRNIREAYIDGKNNFRM